MADRRSMDLRLYKKYDETVAAQARLNYFMQNGLLLVRLWCFNEHNSKNI